MTDLLRELEKFAAAESSFGRLSAAVKIAAHHAEIAEAVRDAERYRWLRTRPAQIGALLWRHAPWTHEGYAENQVRLDLCIDEERVDAMSAAPSAPEGDGGAE